MSRDPAILYYTVGAGGAPGALIPTARAAAATVRGAYPVTVVAVTGHARIAATVQPLGGPVGQLRAGVQCAAPQPEVMSPAAARTWAAALTAAARLAEAVMGKPGRNPVQ